MTDITDPNYIIKAFENTGVSILQIDEHSRKKFYFRASDIETILELTNIRMSIQNFTEDEKGVREVYTLGGTQKVLFLTSKGVYRLLYNSKKQIAVKFRNWVGDILDDIIFNTGQELKKQLEQKDYQLVKLSSEKRLDKQNILLREFGNIGALVYIVKVKEYENGTYVIRLGESRNGVNDRFKSHQGDYGKENTSLLDCFVVNNSKRFEKFLHENLSKHKMRTLPGHENENELFLVGKDLAYSHILQLIENNVHKYNDNQVELEKLRIQHNTLKLITDESNIDKLMEFMNVVLDTNKKLVTKVDNLENLVTKLVEKQNSQETKTTTNFNTPSKTIGPRLQKINHETLLLVKLYDNIAEAINESDHKLVRSSITKAINQNTVYKGFRWNTVDREFDGNIVKVKATKKSKLQNLDFIAKLNDKKTEILNVYLNRSVASLSNGNKSSARLDNVVKKCSLLNGNYYMTYSSCDLDLQIKFQEKHGEPVLYEKTGVGKFDLNGNLIKEFKSQYNCYKTDNNIGHKSLKTALQLNIAYNGYYYKHLGTKLKMI